MTNGNFFDLRYLRCQVLLRSWHGKRVLARGAVRHERLLEVRRVQRGRIGGDMTTETWFEIEFRPKGEDCGWGRIGSR